MDIRDLVRLRKAKDRMDREFDRPLDVPALARSAAMSPGHFSRNFKAAFGESPYSYLMTRRIERAKTLLRRGAVSVTDACFPLGGTSRASFSTQFTQLSGRSGRCGVPEGCCAALTSAPRAAARASRTSGRAAAACWRSRWIRRTA